MTASLSTLRHPGIRVEAKMKRNSNLGHVNQTRERFEAPNHQLKKKKKKYRLRTTRTSTPS